MRISLPPLSANRCAVPGRAPVSSWSFRPISEKVNPRRPVPQPREVFIVQKNVRRVVEVRAVLEIRRVAVKDASLACKSSGTSRAGLGAPAVASAVISRARLFPVRMGSRKSCSIDRVWSGLQFSSLRRYWSYGYGHSPIHILACWCF